MPTVWVFDDDRQRGANLAPKLKRFAGYETERHEKTFEDALACVPDIGDQDIVSLDSRLQRREKDPVIVL